MTIRNTVKYTAILIMLWLIVLLAGRVEAATDYHLIDIRELALDYKNYKMINPNARNALIYPESPKEGVNVELKLDVMNRLFYWDSAIESLTTDSQYRSVGLKLWMGLHLSDHMDVGYYHHSAHILDATQSRMNGFPVEDAVQIKLYLFRTKEPRNSVF